MFETTKPHDEGFSLLRHAIAWVLVVSCVAKAGARASETTPFFRAREHQTEYAGPGREQPPPDNLREIEVGYFGPSDPGDRKSGDMWRAAELAIAAANAEGGFNGAPFRLIPAWSVNPWSAGVKQLTDLVFVRKVWAIVGGVDSASSHLAEQVVAKAHAPLVCPVSTDKTVNLANVPWTFSVVPGDQLLAPPLVDALAERAIQGQIVRLMTDDHDSRMFSREMDRVMQNRGMSPHFSFIVPAGATPQSSAIERYLESRPAVLILVADAEDSANLTIATRAGGFRGPILGGPSLGRRQYLRTAERDAEGAVFPLLFDSQRPPEPEFVRQFEQSCGYPPDYSAAHTYDAVRLTLKAIQTAGLNRAKIRDAIARLSPWQGVSGPISWDHLGSNIRVAQLGTILDGRIVPVPALPVPPASPPHSAPP